MEGLKDSSEIFSLFGFRKIKGWINFFGRLKLSELSNFPPNIDQTLIFLSLKI